MDNTDFSLVWRKRVTRDFVAYALRELRGDDMREVRGESRGTELLAISLSSSDRPSTSSSDPTPPCAPPRSSAIGSGGRSSSRLTTAALTSPEQIRKRLTDRRFFLPQLFEPRLRTEPRKTLNLFTIEIGHTPS